MNGKKIVESVHDKDLENVLQKLNLLEPVKNAEIKCFYCNQTITIDNLQFIFTENDKIVISCNKPACVSRFTQEHGDE
jgi:hypothetical protein